MVRVLYTYENKGFKNHKPLKLNDWFVLSLPLFNLNDNDESYDTLVPIFNRHFGSKISYYVLYFMFKMYCLGMRDTVWLYEIDGRSTLLIDVGSKKTMHRRLFLL